MNLSDFRSRCTAFTLGSHCAVTLTSGTRRTVGVSVETGSCWWQEVKKGSFVCSTLEAELLCASSQGTPSTCVCVCPKEPFGIGTYLYSRSFSGWSLLSWMSDWSKTNLVLSLTLSLLRPFSSPPPPGQYTSPRSCLMGTVCYRVLMICRVGFGTLWPEQNSAVTLNTRITSELRLPANSTPTSSSPVSASTSEFVISVTLINHTADSE